MLPWLHALLDRLIETNKAAEELAGRVLPAVRAVLKRYLTHILPRELKALQTASIRRRVAGTPEARLPLLEPPPEPQQKKSDSTCCPPQAPKQGGFKLGGLSLASERRAKVWQETWGTVRSLEGQSTYGVAGGGEPLDLDDLARLTELIGEPPEPLLALYERYRETLFPQNVQLRACVRVSCVRTFEHLCARVEMGAGGGRGGEGFWPWFLSAMPRCISQTRTANLCADTVNRQNIRALP